VTDEQASAGTLFRSTASSLRHIPGQTPRPGREQDHRAPKAFEGNSTFSHSRWDDSDEYRYGIDLLNFGFWWDSHEVFENLWRAIDPRSSEGVLQAVKRRLGNDAAAKRLASKAVDRLSKVCPTTWGWTSRS
jgi:hypothetical protein